MIVKCLVRVSFIFCISFSCLQVGLYVGQKVSLINFIYCEPDFMFFWKIYNKLTMKRTRTNLNIVQRINRNLNLFGHICRMRDDQGWKEPRFLEQVFRFLGLLGF